MVWTYPESSWNCSNHKNIYGLIAVILKYNSSSISSERAHKYYANFPNISFILCLLVIIIIIFWKKSSLKKNKDNENVKENTKRKKKL